jgi:CBS domain-containing protein
VKRLPVVAPNGSLVGVISRADVVNAFTKPDDVIEDEIREDIVRRLLFLEPDALDVRVRDGVVMLSGRLENRTEAHLLEELTRRLDGVIRVESSLTYEVDDHRIEKMYPLS